MMTSRRAALACMALAVAALAGCQGYSSEPLTREYGETIAVPTFDNQTYWRGLEFELTEAVARSVRERSGLRLAQRTGQADLVLAGDITDYQQPVLSEGRGDTVKEGSARVTVHVRITRRDGTVVADRTMTEGVPFVFSRGESEITARAEAFEDLAERIVALLERDWDLPAAPDAREDATKK